MPLTKKELAIAFIQQHPGLPSRTLARIMYRDRRSIFPSEDAAYQSIRVARGTHGKNKRHLGTFQTLAQLPEPEVFDYAPHFLDGASRILILSDVHIPFHDKTALETAIAEGVRRKCDTVLLNGDLMDCYQLSRFDRAPSEAALKTEIDGMNQFLRYLRRKLPEAEFIWKLGNHEDRLSHFLKSKAPELYGIGVDDFIFAKLTGAEDVGATIISDKRIIVSGHLKILHGHEYKAGFAEPVNPARGLFLRAKTTCMAGHWHQPSQHTEPILGGKHISTWSTGCLCQLSPLYMPLNKWRHGFAIQEVRSDGHFKLHNLTIIDGEIV